jgi:hypothetical protein
MVPDAAQTADSDDAVWFSIREYRLWQTTGASHEGHWRRSVKPEREGKTQEVIYQITSGQKRVRVYPMRYPNISQAEIMIWLSPK